jgi:hypothetical protein
VRCRQASETGWRYDEVVTKDQNERDLLRRWVETWRRAGVELEEIRRREIRATDTQQSIRQIFGDDGAADSSPARTTSGLVEQQALFARLRAKTERQ